jgi:DNA topoisomerase VI subunit A
MFVKRVRETLKIPVLGLFDSDAHGLKILSVYMQGSESMSHDAASLATPDIKWLGVRPSDLDKWVFVTFRTVFFARNNSVAFRIERAVFALLLRTCSVLCRIAVLLIDLRARS